MAPVRLCRLITKNINLNHSSGETRETISEMPRETAQQSGVSVMYLYSIACVDIYMYRVAEAHSKYRKQSAYVIYPMLLHLHGAWRKCLRYEDDNSRGIFLNKNARDLVYKQRLA